MAPSLARLLLSILAVSRVVAAPAEVPGPAEVPEREPLKIGKLRELMLSSYCPTHADTTPCKTHLFLKEMRKTKTLEEKKKMLIERQAKMKAMPPDERRKMTSETKAAFKAMYASYCSTASPPPGRNNAVCEHKLLKRLYSF